MALLLKGFFLILFGVSCSSFSEKNAEEQGYLFDQGRQKHTVSVYDKKSKLISQSVNIVELGEKKATLTTLSPAFTTLMRATLFPNKPGRIDFLGASLEDRKKIVIALLKKLSDLLWIKRGQLGSDVKVLAVSSQGSLRKLEWKLGDSKIFIEVTPL